MKKETKFPQVGVKKTKPLLGTPNLGNFPIATLIETHILYPLAGDLGGLEFENPTMQACNSSLKMGQTLQTQVTPSIVKQ